MTDTKRINEITRAIGKMRFVTRSKWELPIRGSKPYWNKICEGIESKVIRVRKSSTSPTSIPYPLLSPSILNSTSSASCDDINVYDFTKHNPATDIVDSSEPIVKVDPPSPRIFDNPQLRTVKFQSNLGEKDTNDKIESSNGHWRITKLSKMTKLVNEFLSSTRNRVRPSSVSSRKSASPQRRSFVANRKGPLTREQSFNYQSKDDAYHHESTQESNENAINADSEAINVERKVVGFRNDIVEMDVKKFEHGNDIPGIKMGRPRAPSLSIASALPSFGKVVISIEDIDSAEEEESEKMEEQNYVQNSSNFLSKDSLQENVDGEKVSQDFLKVPDIRVTGHASYPLHHRPKFQQPIARNDVATQLKKSKLIMESQVLRKKHGFWPRKSLVNVFRALRAMKHSVQSKARIESETNRFFAAPLDIYSPSARSSISSDDRTDFIDAEDESEHNGEMENEYGEGNESDENVGKESESSYASVRERLMRNAGAHIGMDFEPGKATYEKNALDATFVRENLSSFYNGSSEDVLEGKLRNNRITDASFFIALPRVASMFPRKKVDKCLACMCHSLEDIDQPGGQVKEGRFFENFTETVLEYEEPFGVQSLNETLFERSYRNFVENMEVRKSSAIEDVDEESAAAIRSTSVVDPTAEKLTGTASQVDDSHRSRTIGKSLSKSVINAKSLISSVSSISERSKSISDQDESDQGCADTPGNEVGLAAGSTSKYLAPCHMPVVLKPSLEPLKALRHKKSRSIRSRVASAEKSADSANDDEDDSDDDAVNRKLPLDARKSRLDGREDRIKLDMLIDSGNESDIIDIKQKLFEAIINEEKASKSSKTDETDNISDDEQIISDRDVVKIFVECLIENKNSTEILQELATEYSKRLTNKASRSPRAPNLCKNEKIAKNLVALLVDSKSYLNREKWQIDNFDNSSFSKQPPLCNSRQLKRILPLKSYNLVAPILGMAEWYPRRKSIARKSARKKRRFANSNDDSPQKEFSESAYDLLVHPPSRIGHVFFENSRIDKRPRLNPYALFLTKPRRKAVTWRPLTERDLEGYDPEATLKMRATKITDRICEDFCRWLDSLAAGTNQKSNIDVDVLKDMFETDFTAEVCRTMQLAIKQMPMVPSAVALARKCPGAAELALTRKHLVKDAKAEMKPKQTIGFGTALPSSMIFIPSRNHVNEKWMQCENVPKDLETMDAVWKGITHLSSVKGFIDWLKAHPEVSRPKALENALHSRETLLTRQSQEFAAYELNLDQIQSLKVGDNDPDA